MPARSSKKKGKRGGGGGKKGKGEEGREAGKGVMRGGLSEQDPDNLDAVFAVGDRVRIKGLRARPELNGKEGEVRRCTDWVDVHRPPPATGPHGSKSRSWS